MYHIKKIKVSDLNNLFLYLVFLKPGIINDISWLDFLFNAFRFGFTILFAILMILHRKKWKSVLYPLLIFLFSFLSTWINEGNLSIVMGHWVPILGFLLWFELQKDKNMSFIRIFYKTGLLMMVINTWLIITNPEGIYTRNEGYINVWLLGQKQDFVNCYLPTMFFAFMIHETKPFSFFEVLVWIFAAIGLVITKPLGLSFCLIYFVLIIGINKIAAIDLKGLFILNVVYEIFAVITAFAISTWVNLQNFLLLLPSTSMNKLETMLVRFSMWKYVISIIPDHFFLGVGQMNANQWLKNTNLNFYHTIMHNLPLDILFVGGGIAFSIFILYEIKSINCLRKNEDKRVNKIIGVSLHTLNVLMLTECPYFPLAFILFSLAHHVEKIKSD